jgi:tRNA U34 2-thiouridine synthase MnmA/TrmU
MLIREGHKVIGLTMQLWNQRRLPGWRPVRQEGVAVHWMMSMTRAVLPNIWAFLTTY